VGADSCVTGLGHDALELIGQWRLSPDRVHRTAATGSNSSCFPYFSGSERDYKWGLESGRRAVEPINQKFAELDRLRRIERLAGGAEVDMHVEYALNAAKAASDQYCDEHYDEVMALANHKLSPAAEADWNKRYDAVEANAYKQALAASRAVEEAKRREAEQQPNK